MSLFKLLYQNMGNMLYIAYVDDIIQVDGGLVISSLELLKRMNE